MMTDWQAMSRFHASFRLRRNMVQLVNQLENKLLSIEDRSQTDRVAIIARLTLTLALSVTITESDIVIFLFYYLFTWHTVNVQNIKGQKNKVHSVIIQALHTKQHARTHATQQLNRLAAYSPVKRACASQSDDHVTRQATHSLMDSWS